MNQEMIIRLGRISRKIEEALTTVEDLDKNGMIVESKLDVLDLETGEWRRNEGITYLGRGVYGPTWVYGRTLMCTAIGSLIWSVWLDFSV